MILVPKLLQRFKPFVFCIALFAVLLDRVTRGRRALRLFMDDGSIIDTNEAMKN